MSKEKKEQPKCTITIEIFARYRSNTSFKGASNINMAMLQYGTNRAIIDYQKFRQTEIRDIKQQQREAEAVLLKEEQVNV